ncbi:hypothetical protein GE21DRAFT_1309097 [Neurospora crassa]|nr:hypothetical protein GE21DRAFT_1309097 [Neurospora crassa]
MSGNRFSHYGTEVALRQNFFKIDKKTRGTLPARYYGILFNVAGRANKGNLTLSDWTCFENLLEQQSSVDSDFNGHRSAVKIGGKEEEEEEEEEEVDKKRKDELSKTIAFGSSACSGFGTLPSFAFVKAASTHVGNSTAIATHNGDERLLYSRSIPSPVSPAPTPRLPSRGLRATRTTRDKVKSLYGQRLCQAHKILKNYKAGDIVIVHDYNMTQES